MNLSPFILTNNSLAGILCTCTGLFVLSFLKNRGHIVLVSIFIIGLSVLLQSRAGVLSFFFGITLLAYTKQWLRTLSKKHFVLLVAFFCGVVVSISFLIKTNSTSGRLFIWQNTVEIIKRNWSTGTGWGSFRQAYNDEQARYFMQHGFDSKEALLADTVYYAFNEWLQLAVELGIPVTIALAGVCVFILFSAIKKLKTASASAFQTGAVASFSGLLLGSFISYPFYYMPTLFLFIFLFLYFLYFLWGNKVRATLRYFIIFLVVVCFIKYASFQIYARVQWKEASELTRVAYHLKAKEKLLAAYPILKNNGDFLFSLGLAYSTINQNDSAIFYLCRSALFKNDYELHRKLGELYFEQNNFTKAEEHFLRAVYMVPNRFRSRELLVDFYSKTGNKAKAVYWAESSLVFTVKVPSERVTQIRTRFKAYLKTGNW